MMTPLRTALHRERRPGLLALATHHGRALGNLLRAAWVEYELDRARYFAVAMIYYALVSLVPLLLLLLAALGLLLRFSDVAAETERQTLLAIEAGLGPELAATITRLLDTLQQESVVAIVISVCGLLLAASVLFKHLRLSFRAIWNYDPPLVSGPVRVVVRATILERVVALAMVLGGGGLLLMALGLIAAAQWLDRLLGRLPLLGSTTVWVLTAAISLILAVVTFACLFKVLPPVSMRWRDVWLAALLCGIGWVATSELLALYAVFFGSGSASGVIGGVLAVMLWMNIVSQMLFFGAELCKVVARQSGALDLSPIESSRDRA
jgi:membrane protein